MIADEPLEPSVARARLDGRAFTDGRLWDDSLARRGRRLFCALNHTATVIADHWIPRSHQEWSAPPN